VASATGLAQQQTFLPIDTQANHYKWLVATIVLIAEGTNTFAGNSINLAVPRLMDHFGTDLAATQWVSTGFQIARTLVVPILGWLGGMLGNRNLFVAMMVGFLISTIGCGLSASLGMLIGFRLLQGLVLGPMEGISAVILVEAFPPHQRGLALGLRTIGWSAGRLISDESRTGTAEHDVIMQALKHTLHEAGVVGPTADRTALGAIRCEMDIEAIAAGFRESFLLLALFFILGCMPLVCLLVSQLMERRRNGKAPQA